MGQDGARREIRHAFHPSGASGVSIPGNGCQGGPHEYVRPARSTGPLFPVTIRRCGMACAYAESSVGFPGVP